MTEHADMDRPNQASRKNAQPHVAGDHGSSRTDIPIQNDVVQRAQADPSRLALSDVLALQRTVGNQAVQRMVASVQCKALTVGPANDPYEQEADRVADKVLNMRDRNEGETMQRAPLAGSITPWAQRQPDMGQDELQMSREAEVQRAGAAGSFDPGDDFESLLARSRGGGQPLQEPTRAYMEARFATDLSNVRIHTGSAAIQMSRAINAHAFTHGSDIYMGAGKYNPNSTSGKHLLAHELTHTIQQGGRPPTAQRRSANVASQSRPRVIQRAFGKFGWRNMMDEYSRTPDFTRGSYEKLVKANEQQAQKYKNMSRRQLKRELAKERARYWSTKVLFNAVGPGMFDRSIFWLPRVIDKLSSIDIHFANLIKADYDPSLKPKLVKTTVKARDKFKKGKVGRAGAEDWLKGDKGIHGQRRSGLPGMVEFGTTLKFIKDEAYKFRKARISMLKALLGQRDAGVDARDQAEHTEDTTDDT